MDFGLFMEKYGYKILLVLLALCIFAPVVAIFGGLLARIGGKFGVLCGAILLIGAIVASMTSRRKVDAQGETCRKNLTKEY
ncbi:hypothetical protein [Thermococcus paralvinellae]|uniref:Uncharacterized protein n=1 Tax=Thermococcus paralvinellae TaxID=582419 RepID=W0I131_9EURY|nr:hypothetical protein [Thermococcus paralvinellae]AHF79719.1 Hypothetical protein TES1_0325 [Thermococcus paralvinellae]